MAEDGAPAARPMIAARERGPGPGRYALPSTVGANGHDPTAEMSPSFSFGTQLPNSIFKKTISPGPAYFVASELTRTGPEGTPKYSMLGRTKDLEPFSAPAPGAYSPEKCQPQGEAKAPAYSMGTRTRYRKRDPTPSPNSYSLPSLLGKEIVGKMSPPAFTMAGRATTGGFADDLAKAPGPGKYNSTHPDVRGTKSPAYSMLGRSFMPSDSTKKPGPGAHSPEAVTINKPRAPSFSLGTKHSQYITPLIIDVVD